MLWLVKQKSSKVYPPRPSIPLVVCPLTPLSMQAENCLAWMSERQLSMLSGLLPRHVIEFLSVHSEHVVPKQVRRAAGPSSRSAS